MNIRNFFIAAAIAALSFGFVFVVVPVFIGQVFGVILDADGVLMTRFFGAMLITVGLWFAMLRDTQDVSTIRAILAAYLIGLIIGVINALNGVLSGAFNALGWLIVLLYGGLAVGAAYFLFAHTAVRAAKTPVR